MPFRATYGAPGYGSPFPGGMAPPVGGPAYNAYYNMPGVGANYGAGPENPNTQGLSQAAIKNLPNGYGAGSPGNYYLPEPAPTAYGSYGASPAAGVATRGGALNPASPIAAPQGINADNISNSDVLGAFDGILAGLDTQGQGAIAALDRNYAKARGNATQGAISRGFYGQYGNQPTEELGRYGTVAASLGRGLLNDRSQNEKNILEGVAGQKATFGLQRAQAVEQLRSAQVARDQNDRNFAERQRQFNASQALRQQEFDRQAAGRTVVGGGSGGGYGGGSGGGNASNSNPFSDAIRSGGVRSQPQSSIGFEPYGGGYGSYGVATRNISGINNGQTFNPGIDWYDLYQSGDYINPGEAGY